MSGKAQLPTRKIVVGSVAALAVAWIVAAAALLLPARNVSGQIIDSSTGRPLSGALVSVAGQEIHVGNDGTFSISGVRFGSPVSVGARGYQPVSTLVGLGDQMRLALSPRVLEGTVVEAGTLKPVPGAQILAGSFVAQSDEQGKFRLTGIEPGTEVTARIDGYAAPTLKYDGQASSDLALKPNVLTITAVNQYTGAPVPGAEATDGKATARTDGQGKAQLQYLKDGAEVAVKLDGFAPTKLSFSGQEAAEVRLRPDTVTGTVKDSRGQPLAGITVSAGDSTASTDQNGAFKISGVPENAKLAASGNGYTRKQVDLNQQTNVDMVLEPFSAKGLYLTYYGVGSDELRNHALELADQTEVNTVVIDVKGDRGWMVYKSSIPMVNEIGAQQDVQIQDPKKLLADLKKRGVYTIARIVVFKDNPLATARPDLAVMNAQTGRPWVDNEGLSWADPTRQEVWDYNIALAVEAIQNGFDEVQFDYVRFPTDASAGNSLDTVTFSQENKMANRVAAINGFLEKAKEAIHAAGGNVSADIFGYVVWRTDDMGIGQHLEDVAQHVDYVSPMLYPTLFWDGLPSEGGGKYANAQAGNYPYEIVSESMKMAVKRIGPDKLRPWLQYYNDYINGKNYTAADMEAQKRATYETGVNGWLFWDPSNRYVKGGFDPR